MGPSSSVRECDGIEGVLVVRPMSHEDERGSLSEVFRASQVGLADPVVQANLSISRQGVLRGLHFHRRQFDYWILVQGRMRVGLADLRLGSPTEGAGKVLDLSEGMGLLIPPGVAHGFAALSDLRLLYLVTAYFDGTDEQGVAWDDPDLALPWELPFLPLLSERDKTNPRFSDMSRSQRPSFRREGDRRD